MVVIGVCHSFARHRHDLLIFYERVQGVKALRRLLGQIPSFCPPLPTPLKTYPKPIHSALLAVWRLLGQIPSFWPPSADAAEHLP